MPADAELIFADHLGRLYARRYGYPPMVGRLIGYLAVCDPPAQTIAELADALLASRSGITNAVRFLEATRVVRRSRAAGERVDRIQVDLSSPQAMGMDVTEYEDLRDVMREGLDVVRGAPPERQAILLETIAFAEFLIEEIPKLQQKWEAHRTSLVASGQLPDSRRRLRSNT